MEEIKVAVGTSLLKISQSKALKTLISGLKSNMKINFLFLDVTASSTEGAYKGRHLKLEETEHKRDHKQRRRKRATLANQEEEFEKILNLHWHIYFVL